MLAKVKSTASAAKEVAVKKASTLGEGAKASLASVKTSAVEHTVMIKESAQEMMRAREVPVILERLQAGHAVYSQSFASDFWLFLKNNHLIFSLFFAHPKHPFSACERRVCLTCSLALGFGITCLLTLSKDDVDAATLTIMTIMLGGILQGVYDTLLKIFATCSCVQSCPTPIRVIFECCGSVGLIVQFFFGAAICVSGALALQSLFSAEEFNAATWQFFASKFQAWFVTSVLVASLSFWMRRRQQLPPTDPKAYEEWNKTPKPGFCFGNKNKKPKSFLWNKYIGKDKTIEDLPLRSPRYAYRLCCMNLGQDEPLEVPSNTDDVELGAPTDEGLN